MVPWNEEPISLDNAARAFQNDPWEDLVMRNARIATAIVQTIAVSALCIVLGAGNDSTPVSFQILGIKMTLEVTAPQSNGASVTIEERVPPGGGPPAQSIRVKTKRSLSRRGTFDSGTEPAWSTRCPAQSFIFLEMSRISFATSAAHRVT
jgi:hypothetical protein